MIRSIGAANYFDNLGTGSFSNSLQPESLVEKLQSDPNSDNFPNCSIKIQQEGAVLFHCKVLLFTNYVQYSKYILIFSVHSIIDDRVDSSSAL